MRAHESLCRSVFPGFNKHSLYFSLEFENLTSQAKETTSSIMNFSKWKKLKNNIFIKNVKW